MPHISQSRLVLAVFPLVAAAVGMIGIARARPLVHIGPGSGLFAGTDFAVLAAPAWAALCLAVGLVLLVVLLAVGDLRDVLKWSAPLLLVLWVLQIAYVSGVYLNGDDNPPGSSWLTQYTSISTRWWGFAIVFLTVVAIAVGSRLGSQQRKPQQSGSGKEKSF